MKKLLLCVGFVAPFYIGAQTTVISENFDTYADADTLSIVGAANGWGEWSGGTGTAESCTASTNYAVSGTVSGRSSGSNDCLWTWTDITAGKIELNMSVYAVTDGGGYIGLGDAAMSAQPHTLHVYSDTLLAYVDWAGPTAILAPISAAGWYTLKVVFDIDGGTSEFFVDGTSMGTATCGFGAAAPFGGIDFWAKAYDIWTGDEPQGDLYFDDMSIVDVTGVGLEENSITYSIYPNPASDILTIESNQEIENITIISLDGKVVLNDSANGMTTQVTVSNLIQGSYVVEMTTASGTIVRKTFVKK
jgi:hypothetical protein